MSLKNHSSQFQNYYQLGRSLVIIGGIAILFQLIINFIVRLRQTIFDYVPSEFFIRSNEFLYITLISCIGLVSILGFLTGMKIVGEKFKEGKYKDGLVNGILEAGEQLKKHFPYNHEEDTNELSNEISRG